MNTEDGTPEAADADADMGMDMDKEEMLLDTGALLDMLVGTMLG